jgi:hypothetical protein
MLSEFLDNQVSGNNWNQPPIPMAYQEFQQAATRAEPRLQRDFLRDIERQMAAFEADHRAFVNEIRKNYVLPKDSSVADFLDAHRTIPALLMQAVPHLREFFGTTVFALRASSDEYGWQTLYADAMWPGDAHDAVVAIDRFEDAWWIANSDAASGSLTFTYRLV